MRWFALLWAIGLGFVVALGALRAGVFDMAITLPVDLDLLLIVTSGVLVLSAGFAMSFKRAMDRLRQLSVERAREEAFAEHRRFLLRLDHELKNPLTAIVAGLVNLSEDNDSPEHRKVLASMETQAQRLSRVVTDLRKLAEIETLPLEQGNIDLRPLLEESIEAVQERADAGQRRLSLSLPLPEKPPTLLYGDRDLILLALHNLLDNAFKFTRPGDTIAVSGQVSEDTVQIDIRDSGVGIPDRELPLVWEELYRGKGAVGTLGSGVGLSLVQVIVRRNGGTVTLDSQVGQGTNVTLRFPLVRE